MDESNEFKSDGFRHLTKSRVMGKLFGREKKPSSNDDDVSAFLHGPSDKLYMAPSTAAPKFPKLDTSTARRWPTAAEVNRSRDTSRRRSTSPKRSKKGLIVRFTDTQPEIIGEGGDEAESPTLEISERKRSNSHPPIIQWNTQTAEKSIEHQLMTGRPQGSGLEVQWTATALKGSPEIGLASGPIVSKEHGGNSITSAASNTSLEAEPTSPNSNSSRMKAEMRAAEGRAFKLASQSPEKTNNASSNDISSESKGLTPVPLPISARTPSPNQVPSQFVLSSRSSQSGNRGGSLSNGGFQAVAVAVGVEAVRDFSNRLQHLFKLFELSAESVVPITSSSFEALVRAASWWFLKGRASIETAIRARPSSPEGQRSYNILRQQGHADVAKSLWIIRDIVAQRAELKMHQTDDLSDLITASRSTGDEFLADMLERCQTTTVNLRMLILSMQRNDCLPPPAEDAPLPQGLDTSIWIKYPTFPPDVALLLSGSKDGVLNAEKKLSRTKISDAMPFGDTIKSFEYARLFVDVSLMEEGLDSQQNHCPSIMFVSRPTADKNLMITISSQNGLVSLIVKSDRALGLTWNDVNWQSRMNAIEVKLPRGFFARVQCSPNDYKTLWNMYDYTSKIHASLWPRKDEAVVFEITLRSFQYFDRDPQSRLFPKEPIARCQVRVLEKRVTEATSHGARSKYRGFRVAVVTGTATKNLSGISQDMPLGRPLEYGFMRGEEGAPALLLKLDDGSKKPTLVLTFDNVSDRSQLYSCVTGGVGEAESILAYVPIKDFSVTGPSRSDHTMTQDEFDNFEWQGVRIIGKLPVYSPSTENASSGTPENLRLIVDAKTGNITDRISIGPGEMNIRLSTQFSKNEIMILRKPQADMSISISESQVSKETPARLTSLLEAIINSQTIRKFSFPEIENLHVFQTAVTGYTVLFDGLVETFAISRRRSVVSIHKKWEALSTRVQILRYDKSVQLAAFFDKFSHGECMNFTLKVTDTFESFSRSGKFCLRIVDAKFATPKGGGDGDEGDDKGFLCLDIPEYPGEHDDITVTFDTEANREKFVNVLPAPVKAISKLGTVRR